MSNLNEQSSLNEFWEAITEIVQGNTPSPAEPELETDHYENIIEPQKYTYDIFVNPAVENYSSFSSPKYPYICNEEKLKTQSFIDLILNKDIPDKQDNFKNQSFIDAIISRDINKKEEIANDIPNHNLTSMNSSVSEAEQISFIKALIQNNLNNSSIPVDESAPKTPSSFSEYHDEDDNIENGEEQFSLNMDLDVPMPENKSFINDNELIQLSVRDLNRKLKIYPKEDRKKLKQRRRLLKNRGYAQTCRTRRINTQKTLLEENQHLKELLQQTNIEKNMYKTKYENLKSLIKKAKMDRERKRESFEVPNL